MFKRGTAVLFTTVVVVAAACGGGAANTAKPSTGTASAGTASTAPASAVASAATGGSTGPGSATAGCTVGVSWNNYQEERWAKWDEPAIKAALQAGGASYISNDAKSSAETQLNNVQNLITQGAKVVIILAQDGTAIKPAVTAALQAGVPVIAYDRLIEDPGILYVTFDNVKIGELEAQGVLAVKNAGNFVIIKGNKADANADFLRQGYVNAGIPAVGATDPNGKIKIVGETYTDNWDPKNAQTEMEQFLTANNNAVDAVLSENDGMAGGVVAALTAQGLQGKVPVSGQDGDQAALNRIALGTQTVDIWKDARLLGDTAGKAAVQLCGNPDPSKVSGTAKFTTPGNNSVNSILLTPQAITKDNLNVVLDAKWIDKATLCQGVTPGSVGGC